MQVNPGEKNMKKLQECKTYFNDLFFNCLDCGAVEKSIFDSIEKAQFETLCDTLKFIYGAEFENIRLTWMQEALNEYYGMVKF